MAMPGRLQLARPHTTTTRVTHFDTLLEILQKLQKHRLRDSASLHNRRISLPLDLEKLGLSIVLSSLVKTGNHQGPSIHRRYVEKNPAQLARYFRMLPHRRRACLG